MGWRGGGGWVGGCVCGVRRGERRMGRERGGDQCAQIVLGEHVSAYVPFLQTQTFCELFGRQSPPWKVAHFVAVLEESMFIEFHTRKNLWMKENVIFLFNLHQSKPITFLMFTIIFEEKLI